MNLKISLTIAITLSFVFLGGWELFWRSKGKIPDIDDNKDLWAVQRAKVNRASPTDIVFLGSSRALFDLQLDEWEQVTGVRPIQLACAGSSPLPVFHDLVNNTNFKGTIIVGVTSPLFFSTTYPKAGPWRRAQSRVDYFENRTYAQKLNHALSLPLQENLVFISTSEEGWSDDIDLKSLLKTFPSKNRSGEPLYPPFNSFSYMSRDRNNVMSKKTATDTAFANSIQKAWKFILSADNPPPDKDGTTAFFTQDAKKFKERGGNLILLRCPSSGMFLDVETKFFPRSDFWDQLVAQSGARAYHFQDYDNLKNLSCPEWSHLSVEDAKYFTLNLANIMKNDGALIIPNTN